MALQLLPTKRFSIFSFEASHWPQVLPKRDPDPESDDDENFDDFGSDAPLGDLALQVILESMNLVPGAVTERVRMLIN